MSRGVFRFLDLSAELRNKTYICALQQDGPVRLEYLRGIATSEKDDVSPRRKPSPYLGHNILRTCRQIYEEARPIPYSFNTFSPYIRHQDNHLRLFLKQIGGRIEYIRHIELHAGGITGPIRQVCHLLKQAVSLASLSFIVPQGATSANSNVVDYVRSLLKTLDKKRKSISNRRIVPVEEIAWIREDDGVESAGTKDYEADVREELAKMLKK